MQIHLMTLLQRREINAIIFQHFKCLFLIFHGVSLYNMLNTYINAPSLTHIWFTWRRRDDISTRKKKLEFLFYSTLTFFYITDRKILIHWKCWKNPKKLDSDFPAHSTDAGLDWNLGNLKTKRHHKLCRVPQTIPKLLFKSALSYCKRPILLVKPLPRRGALWSTTIFQ